MAIKGKMAQIGCGLFCMQLENKATTDKVENTTAIKNCSFGKHIPSIYNVCMYVYFDSIVHYSIVHYTCHVNKFWQIKLFQNTPRT